MEPFLFVAFLVILCYVALAECTFLNVHFVVLGNTF